MPDRSTGELAEAASSGCEPHPAVTNMGRRGKMAGADLRFVFSVALTLCVLTTLPYAVGYGTSFPGSVFTGVLDHSLDTNNYLAYIHQSAKGKWLFYNPMTGEPHRPVFFNLEWLVMGKMAFLLHLSPPAAMNFSRLLCLALMCMATYWLSTFLFHSAFVRKIALVASLAGGGFGWLAAVHLFHVSLDSSYFLDLTNANLFPFYWALRVPHFLVSELFVVLGLCFFLRAEIDGKLRNYAAAGACYLEAGGCRPYDMLFLIAATTLYLIVSHFVSHQPQFAITYRAVPVLMCLPFLGYYYWIFKIHPIFRWWSLPGRPAPPLGLLALGFGMSFLCFAIAVWKFHRQRIGQPEILMLCCLVTALIFAYTHRVLHFSFQFATNILIPMVMLALAGFERSITSWKANRRWALAVVTAILLVNSFTSIALTGQAVLLTARGEYCVPAGLLAAFSWLDAHSQTSDAVLADLNTANAMPRYTHNRVFCGYGNAVNVEGKLRALGKFFDAGIPNEFRENLLRENAIQFVLLTNAQYQDLPELGRASFLKEEFRNHAAVIFSVQAHATS